MSRSRSATRSNLIATSVILLCTGALAAACEDPDKLSKCGAPCYTGPEGTENVGTCYGGVITCTATATWCARQQLPRQVELCNGLDDDCDGTIDNQTRPCSTACGVGLEVCVRGEWIGCDAPRPEPEVCDGVDTDCDGVDDNDVRHPDGVFCYTGPAGTATNTPCHPGVWACNRGRWDCIKQQTPGVELCGDGLDNDCDGTADNTPGATHVPLDVVVIIDWSCSMGDDGYLGVVTEALGTWAPTAPADTQFWQFVLPAEYALGDTRPVSATPSCPDRVRYRPCPMDAMLDDLAGLRANGGGDEPSYTALTYVIDTVKWRSTAQHVIMIFTDEEGQPQGLQWRVVQQLGTFARVLAFVDPNYRVDFDGIAAATNGAVFLLPDLNADKLRSIFVDATAPLCAE